MEVEASNAERHLERLPQDLVISVRARVEAAKAGLQRLSDLVGSVE